MARKHYRRWWRQTGDSLTDHIVCPKCGENSVGRDSSMVRCGCEDGGKCFSMEDGLLTWRRSPCSNAECKCGWKGVLRSASFEHEYHCSRCRMSDNGWHDVAVSVYKNENPGPLTIELRCKACGAKGHKTIDAVNGIAWSVAEREDVE